MWNSTRDRPPGKVWNPNRVGLVNPHGLSSELPEEPIYNLEEICTLLVHFDGGNFHIDNFMKTFEGEKQKGHITQVGPDRYRFIPGYVDHAMARYAIEKDKVRFAELGLEKQGNVEQGGQKQLPFSDGDGGRYGKGQEAKSEQLWR